MTRPKQPAGSPAGSSLRSDSVMASSHVAMDSVRMPNSFTSIPLHPFLLRVLDRYRSGRIPAPGLETSPFASLYLYGWQIDHNSFWGAAMCCLLPLPAALRAPSLCHLLYFCLGSPARPIPLTAIPHCPPREGLFPHSSCWPKAWPFGPCGRSLPSFQNRRLTPSAQALRCGPGGGLHCTGRRPVRGGWAARECSGSRPLCTACTTPPCLGW